MALLSTVTYSTITRPEHGLRALLTGGNPLGRSVRKAVLMTVRPKFTRVVALPVVVGLLALTAQPADAQTRKTRSSRSQATIARKAASARARAVATAREMQDTTVPRYKVDASGDLVPDLRPG